MTANKRTRTEGLRTDRSQPVTPEAALLQCLLEGPSFGLDLIERIKHKVALHQGTVYPLLRRLDGRGWLRGHEGDPPEGGGRPRRYYQLTPAGRRAAIKQAQAVTALFGIAPNRRTP